MTDDDPTDGGAATGGGTRAGGRPLADGGAETDDAGFDAGTVARRAAAAQEELGRAVSEGVGALDSRRPEVTLGRVADALADAHAEVRRAVDAAEAAAECDTPRDVVDAHATRYGERYDGPVLCVATQLLEHNRRKWLHGRPETNGAEAVRQHGLTANQRRWLDRLQEAHEAAEQDGGG